MLSSNLPDKVKRGQKAALEFHSILKARLGLPDGILYVGTMLCAAAWLRDEGAEFL